MTNTPDSTGQHIRARVRAVADDLFQKGIRPSVENVREVLQTGSKTTIADELNHWLKDTGMRHKTLLSMPGIPKGLSRAFSAIWTQAVEEAKNKLSSERDGLMQTVAELETRLAAAMTNLELAEEKTSTEAKRYSAEHEKVIALTRHLEEAQAALIEANESHAVASAVTQQENSELTHKLQRLTEQAEGEKRWHAQHVDEARQATKIAQTALEKTRRETDEAISAIRIELAASATEIKSLSARAGEQSGIILTLQAEIKKREAELLDLRKSDADNAHAAATASARVAEMEAALQEMRRLSVDGQTPRNARRRPHGAPSSTKKKLTK